MRAMRPGSSGDRPHSGHRPDGPLRAEASSLSRRLETSPLLIGVPPSAGFSLLPRCFPPLAGQEGVQGPRSSLPPRWFRRVGGFGNAALCLSPVVWVPYVNVRHATSTFRRSNRGPSALSHGRPSSPKLHGVGHGPSCAGAWSPAPCSRCRISPWPLRCSFRFNVRQFRRLLLMVACQRLQGPAEPFGLRCVVEMPLKACCLPSLLLVGSHARLPEFAFLVGVFLARATLYHGVEFLLDHLAACYVHLSSPPVLAHGIAFPRSPKSVASVVSDARVRCFCEVSTGISAGIRRMSDIRPCIIRGRVASSIRLIYGLFVLADITGTICGGSSQGYGRACFVPLAARLDAHTH